MRTAFPCVLLFASAVALFADTQQPGTVASDDEKEILRLEKVINEAWLKHDVATISQIVADDFESWSFKGQRRGRADLLKYVANNKETKTEVADEKVRVFGDTAIYTALITDSFIDNKGITASETTAVTIVYVRRGGEWKMVQDHESLLQK